MMKFFKIYTKYGHIAYDPKNKVKYTQISIVRKNVTYLPAYYIFAQVVWFELRNELNSEVLT